MLVSLIAEKHDQPYSLTLTLSYGVGVGASCYSELFVATFCNHVLQSCVFVAQDNHTIGVLAPHLTLQLLCPAQQAEMFHVSTFVLFVHVL